MRTPSRPVLGLALLAAAWPFAAALPSASSPQDPLEARLQGLIQRSRDGEAAAREAAGAELRQLVARSWADCFAVYAATEDQALAAALRHELGIDAASRADVVLRGEIARLEHAQGGVVDHHDLIAHFRRPFEVLKGEELAAKHRLAPTMLLLARGTHRDTWLCELMKRDLERGPADVVLALNARALRHAAAEGGPETAFVFFEFQVLPAAAEAALEDLTGTRRKAPR